MNVHVINPSITNAPGEAKAGSHGQRSRRKLIVLLVAALLICAVAGIWWFGFASSRGMPAANAEPVRVARFVASSQFQKIPEQQRLAYLDAVREGKEKIAEAYDHKQITASEYESALLNAWISRSLKHVDEYFQHRDGKPRQEMLERVVNKGEKKRLSTTRPSPSTIYDKDPYELDVVKQLVAGWPDDRRAQWEGFRRALQKRRQELHVSVASGIWY
jgi:hypothetical protein